MATAKGATGLSQALAHLPGSPLVWVIVLVLGFLVVYRFSLFLFPMRMCRRCGGSGHVSGFLGFGAAFCGRCGGRGLVPRLGTYVLDMRARSLR